MGFLDTDNNTSALALCCEHMKVINQIIDEFKECFKNHIMPTEGHKITLNLYVASSLKPEVNRSSISPENVHQFLRMGQLHILPLMLN